ncbi:MAG TPA: hydroxyacylglutathione hydrolase [Bdellovibrionales bacterium]|nr:hydroxyacylglutathione hydrolase [Bdellovibrionales bacterium]
MNVSVLPALSDNYVYILRDESAGLTAAVDPSEAGPVVEWLESRGHKLNLIYNTHHHWDHVGGNVELRTRYGCEVLTSGYDFARVNSATEKFEMSEVHRFGHNRFQVFEIPGHTLGHVALWFEDAGIVFTGDTLFGLGCGRLFEGTPQQMWDSLSRLASLPDETLVYCGHEYTRKNCEFALSLDPKNSELSRYYARLTSARERGEPTVPSRLGDEKRLNPFLRCGDAAYKKLLGFAPDAPAVDVFAHVRRLKDGF